jgi:ABC-type transport system substrate-binding protein
MRRARVATVVAAVGLAAAAHAETRPGYGGAVVGTLLGEPASLDPIAARSHAEVTVAGLVFDGLYRAAADGAIVPHLAAALPVVTGNRARIALRPGITFHDGSALDAGDVAASLRRLAKSDAGWVLAPVASIEVVGDAVELVLRAPTPDLAALLALPAASITPGGEAPGKLAIGSGPFRVASLDRRRQRLALAAWNQHVAGRPYLDELELRWFGGADAEARLFETGGAQLSQRGATVFAGHEPKFVAGEVESPATVLVYVGFGTRRGAVTGNRDLRQALSLVVARGGFAAIGTGERVEPALEPVPAELGGAAVDSAGRAGNLALARAALTRAGAAVSALRADRLGALRLEILIDASRPDDRAVAERLVRDLDKLGIGAAIAAAPAPTVAARVARGDVDLVIGQLATASPSPALVWAAAFEAGRDPWARRQLAKGGLDLAQARAEHGRDLPIVPLYHRSLRVHHRRDVRGLGFDGAARLGFADLFLFGAPERAGQRP